MVQAKELCLQRHYAEKQVSLEISKWLSVGCLDNDLEEGHSRDEIREEK